MSIIEAKHVKGILDRDPGNKILVYSFVYEELLNYYLSNRKYEYVDERFESFFSFLGIRS
jgi:hypothetical protein